MSEMMFSSVSSMDDFNRKEREVSHVQDSTTTTSVDNETSQVSESKQSVKTSNSSKRGYPINDVELKFELNRDTDQLTVFVVDKTSKSVLRTIPPDELANLDAGDLLEIAA